MTRVTDVPRAREIFSDEEIDVVDGWTLRIIYPETNQRCQKFYSPWVESRGRLSSYSGSRWTTRDEAISDGNRVREKAILELEEEMEKYEKLFRERYGK